MKQKKLLILIGADAFFCSHFLERAIAAREAGFEVVVVTPVRRHADCIRDAGLRLVPLALDRKGVNPWRELRTLASIWRIYRREQADIVYQVALKQIFYGGLVAHLGVRSAIVNAPVGMGYVFSSNDILARVLRPLFGLAFRLLLNPRRSRVILENSDDLRSLIRGGVLRERDARLIRGAGVDLERYAPVEPPPGPPVVVLVARMLRDKGVGEFVEAARSLHSEGVSARFVLVGDADPGNPASFSREQLREWDGKDGLEWWGWTDDVASVLRQAHIACLPSYREGLPKSLLEALAFGLPVVTTDTPGCREVVHDGVNGFLVPVRDVGGLTTALRRLLIDAELRSRMGAAGRHYAEESFGQRRILAETLAVYSELVEVPEQCAAAGKDAPPGERAGRD